MLFLLPSALKSVGATDKRFSLMILLSMYRLYPATVCSLATVYFGVAVAVAVLLLVKASAGDAIGATIAMASISVSIILTAVRMIVLFDSESVLFFMTQVLLLDSGSASVRKDRRAGKVLFTVKCPLRKPIIAPVFSEFSEHPLRKAVA
jgi:hypothetical protein